MAELPTNIEELLEFLGVSAQCNEQEQPMTELDDLLERARSAASYLEDLLKGSLIDRIVIIEPTS